MWDPYADFESDELQNGLRVYASCWPGRSWERVGFVVHTGADQDPVGLEGLVHFVEHMVSISTSKQKEDIKEFFYNCGGDVGLGSTGFWSTKFDFFVPITKSIFVRALSLFGEMILLAQFEKNIEREREIILREFTEHYPFDYSLLFATKEHKALYPGHRLERAPRPFGLPQFIRKIQKPDLRACYDQFYTPANISIVGVGGLSVQSFFRLIKSSVFSREGRGKRMAVPSLVSFPPPLEKRYVLYQPLRTSVFRTVTRVPLTRDLGFWPINIFLDVLNKILWEEIREKRGWVYDISASFCDFGQFFRISIVCAVDSSKLDDVEELVNKCIEMCEDEATFEKTRKRLIIADKLLDLTGGNVCSGAMDDIVGEQRIISVQEDIKRARKVSFKDIKFLIQAFSPSDRWTGIITEGVV